MITLEERNARLNEAKALVLKGWCRVDYAKDAEGFTVHYTDPNAACFCLFGAILRVSYPDRMKPVEDRSYASMHDSIRDALGSLGYDGAGSKYNDALGRTKYEVAALFDHAKEQPL